jgi:hypothetical protein
MSHRKKRSSEEYLPSTWAEVRVPSPPAAPDDPHPPRPNKPLLITSIVLLAIWILFLLAMAVWS